MNDEEFCELAALYVLDLLDEEERRLVEERIAQFPEYEQLAIDLGEAVAALPYSTPDVPIAANLKERLFERIAEESIKPDNHAIDGMAGFAAFSSTTANLPYFAVRAADVRWQPHPVLGVEIAILYEDRAKREIVCLLRAEPGVHYPAHRHAGFEEIFMLEGDLAIDGEVYGKGDYIRSVPGSIHDPRTSNGCMFFIRTSLDDEMLN